MNWINALIVMGSIFIPTFIAVGLFFWYRKWQDRDGRRSPIENRAIYGAGEQLRKRVEAHTAALIPHAAVSAIASFRKHVNGHVMHLRPSVLQIAGVRYITKVLS